VSYDDEVRRTVAVDKLCVAVGVSEYGAGLESLPGAAQAAREVCDWAAAAGYITLLVTDDNKDPVTVERLKVALERILDETELERLIFYFAGHGTIRSAAEEHWLLSNVLKEPDEVIDRTQFLLRLATFDIAQIAFFIDACRSQSKMALDLGRRGVIKNSGVDRKNPQVDIFLAASLGDSAFHVKDARSGKYRCLFTDVLLTGLYGHPSAIEKSHPEAPAVVSATLATFVEAEVSKRAADISRKAEPEIRASFRRPKDVYLRLPKGQQSDAGLNARKNPPPRSVPPERSSEEAARQALEQVVPDFLKKLVFNEGNWPFDILKPHIWPFTFAEYNLAGWSKRPKAIASSDPQPQFAKSDPQLVAIRSERDSSNLFVMTDSDEWCFVPLFKKLIQFISLSGTSLAAVSSIDWHLDEGTSSLVRGYQEVLGPMLTGDLRAVNATWLADRIRYPKHSNPVMGVIAAYLYAASGDLDNIVRMAHYYFGADQPVPFDIAMLGASRISWETDREQGFKVAADFPAVGLGSIETGVDGEQRPEFSRQSFDARTGLSVAGFMPWMTQGWSVFDREPRMEVPKLLLEIKSGLSGGTFTTLGQDAGSYLVGSLGFPRVDVPGQEGLVGR
jgi:hypothetical protein